MSERLAVVVPAFNEEKTIRTTVESIAARQTERPDALIVVDNNSSDETPDILQDLQGMYGDNFLHVVDEERKGTGAACRTGFEYAMEIGADVIARTDADTVPYPGWCRAIGRYFFKRPNVVSCAGVATAARDEFYMPYDVLRMPIRILGYRALNAIKSRSLMPAFALHGHNMAVRTEAYQEVGGFEPTSIAECDEDLVLFEKLYEKFGPRRTGFNPLMIVGTSCRRVSIMGMKDVATYYDNMEPGLSRNERAKRRLEISGGNVDIR